MSYAFGTAFYLANLVDLALLIEIVRIATINRLESRVIKLRERYFMICSGG